MLLMLFSGFIFMQGVPGGPCNARILHLPDYQQGILDCAVHINKVHTFRSDRCQITVLQPRHDVLFICRNM